MDWCNVMGEESYIILQFIRSLPLSTDISAFNVESSINCLTRRNKFLVNNFVIIMQQKINMVRLLFPFWVSGGILPGFVIYNVI